MAELPKILYGLPSEGGTAQAIETDTSIAELQKRYKILPCVDGHSLTRTAQGVHIEVTRTRPTCAVHMVGCNLTRTA